MEIIENDWVMSMEVGWAPNGDNRERLGDVPGGRVVSKQRQSRTIGQCPGWAANEGLELQVMENDVVKTLIGGN